MPERDRWSEWLLEKRFGGDAKLAEQGLKGLRQLRDTLLAKARLREGQVLLDVGAGDGLIAFGAIEKLGASGRVILADISRPLLDQARANAEQLGVAERCKFIEASAEDLWAIESESVDVVTTRSVLIYVKDKQRALREFYRVLKPGGRTALFETVDWRGLNRPAEALTICGLFSPEQVKPVEDLSARLMASFDAIPIETMTSAGHAEYLHMCEDAGFSGTHIELHVGSGSLPATKLETALNVSFNPLQPTAREQMEKIFTPEECARFTEHIRPLVEGGKGRLRSSHVFIWAFKAPIPENPW